MFTELDEAFRPENYQLPAVRQVNLEEWVEFTHNWETTPDGWNASQFINGALVTAFADAKHVEFFDMLTGRMCLPPEMYLIPVFKGMAKSLSPFIVAFQFAYRTPRGYPTRYSPVPTQEHTTRVFALEKLLYANYVGEYDWRRAYQRRTAAHLNVDRHASGITPSYLGTSLYSLSRSQPCGCGLRSNEEGYVIYIPEEAENATNE